MKLNEELALFLLDKHQPRRKRLLENLLVGKKTVATIYWALRYQILGYLGLGRYMEITKLDFTNLEKQKLVIKDENQAYVLTDKGYILRSKIIGDNLKFNWQRNFQSFNFMRFKSRLLLFIQVISEYQHNQRKYYPVNVSDSEMNFVKYYFKKIDRESIAFSLKNELLNFFGVINNENLANQLANELVGFQKNGRTLFQLANEFDESLIKVYLSDIDVISQLIDFVVNNQESVIFPLLKGLHQNVVSDSAIMTLNQYLINHDISKVALKRHLKESTIYEHLMEIAIYFPINKFPYSDFINDVQIEELKEQLSDDIDKWNYENLSLKQSLSFFQFRLVEIYLTKVGNDE